ncbi:glycosyltransferase [Vibrio parahaemolyticus]|uniref:glycosyltransferase n=1 Tax=Vibrio parahaemolyticus TaxID=670 RepID=UPI00112223E7|nr:glycosyltransferase [Vibrio parahaemolyticus]MDL1989967.1 glycosyltransferase [Vibrio parahaemolyticus]TPA92165.1 glycosyltransferase [Vibrio parahaemolyticus]HCE2422525.1 glycosyltransferase [Vibrio parahaemolyticus]
MFSIVTINFNNAKGISDTFDSINSQNIDRSLFEYIVIDGGSTDHSKYEIENNRENIDKFIGEPDHGIFDAMNKGVNLATQKYIFFLNSGDTFFDDNTLQMVYDSILSSPGHCIYQGRVDTYLDGLFLREAELKPWVCHQGVFVETGLVKRFKFDPCLKVFGDLDLWYRLREYDLYHPFKVDVNICNMSMDGVGNCPSLYKSRIEDKARFCEKHNLARRYYIDYIKLFLGFCFYKAFGLKAYHRFYVGFFSYLRRVLR